MDDEQQNYLGSLPLSREERRHHLYILGKGNPPVDSLFALALHDIVQGEGVCVISTRGTATKLLDYIPGSRVNQTIHWSPAKDTKRPFAWNLLEHVLPDDRAQVAAFITNIFHSIWGDLIGPQTGNILFRSLEALMCVQGATLLGVYTMLISNEYRNAVARNVNDPLVRAYWRKEFGSWDAKRRAEAVAPLQNKLGRFLSHPVRNIIAQTKSTVDMPFFLRSRKVLLIDLKGLSTEQAKLLGSLIIAALSFASAEDTPDCYLYVDSPRAFAPDVLTEVLNETEHHLNLTIATSHTGQLKPELQEALFGSCGNIAAFRVGHSDAKRLHQEFGSLRLKERDFVEMRHNRMNVKLISTMNPSTAQLLTLPEVMEQTFRDSYRCTLEKTRDGGEEDDTAVEKNLDRLAAEDAEAYCNGYGYRNSIMNYSRTRYGRSRSRVERKLARFSKRWLI